MRTLFLICLCSLIISCCKNATETENQNKRINLIEQRLDSLIENQNKQVIINQIKSENIPQGDAPQSLDQCRAITKKGTQCKRAAKESGYCWQHKK